MSHRTNTVSSTIIGILSVLGAAAGTAIAQDNLGKPPVQLVVPPPAPPAGAQPAATGRAQLVFEEMEHDFGKVKDDAPVSYEFKFANKGDGVLKFASQPKASCGCTVDRSAGTSTTHVEYLGTASTESKLTRSYQTITGAVGGEGGVTVVTNAYPNLTGRTSK